MKLTIEELQKLTDLMKRFHSIDTELASLETRVNEIDSEKKVIHAKIKLLEDQANSARSDESDFMDELFNKYGEFRINMETFEIEPS